MAGSRTSRLRRRSSRTAGRTTAERSVGPLLDRLERLFGRPRPERRLPPLDELVLTILSQPTSDTHRATV